jgi:hypothetical protein
VNFSIWVQATDWDLSRDFARSGLWSVVLAPPSEFSFGPREAFTTRKSEVRGSS